MFNTNILYNLLCPIFIKYVPNNKLLKSAFHL
jgi:hypothetical protein